MFKNLYRLRLLDFFELTAATGAALYVYRFEGWYEFERPWIVAGLSIAAILTWIATRLTKTDPIPGLFLSSYFGALFGITDLSPWMTVFGRSAVVETALQLFPESVPSDGWQEKCSVVACVVILMTLPSMLFSCTWVASWNLIQLARKKFKTPKTWFNRGWVAAQFLIAFVFMTGLGYYSLRPQIRFVHTIRIPKQDRSTKTNTPPQVEQQEPPYIAA